MLVQIWQLWETEMGDVGSCFQLFLLWGWFCWWKINFCRSKWCYCDSQHSIILKMCNSVYMCSLLPPLLSCMQLARHVHGGCVIMDHLSIHVKPSASFVERWTTDLPLLAAAAAQSWIILESVCWSSGWVEGSGEREGEVQTVHFNTDAQAMTEQSA